VKDFFAQSTHGIQHPNLHSAKVPVPHDVFTILKPPMDCKFHKAVEESLSHNRHGATTSATCQDPYFFPLMSTSPHLITQQDLNNLVRDVNLSQTQSFGFMTTRIGEICWVKVLISLNLGADSVILKCLSFPQKILCIVMTQMACLEQWAMFIIEKGGGFILAERKSV